ncbi:unnamed protein product [Closterium sp. NIES-53]
MARGFTDQSLDRVPWCCVGVSCCHTSADKLLARAILCVFLGFSVAALDFAFYQPPLHRFLDSHDVQFDEYVSYYVRYPYRSPVPPPPLFLTRMSPPAPALPVALPSPGPTPSCVSHATPLPSVARKVSSPSQQSSSQSPQQPSALPRHVAVDSGGVGAGGAGTGGARFVGARLGGVGGGGAGTRGAGSGGAGAGGAGAGVTGPGGRGFGGAGAGGARTGGASSEGTGAGGTTHATSTPPPHRYD